MPDAQFNSGVDIINYVKERVPSVKRVAGHRDFMATACPGDTFPLEELAGGVKRVGQEAEVKKGMVYNWMDDNMPQWARPTVQKLLDRGLLQGNEKGELELDDTMLRLLVINDRAGLY
jgi:N-acetylmuramoyl-L-alanine amidase